MPAGPLFPYSESPKTSGTAFEFEVTRGDGRMVRGLGVIENVNVNGAANWHLEWELPPALPVGTLTLRLRAMALATSGAAKVNPKWNVVAVEADYAAVVAEGTQTVTWAAGDSGQWKELKIVLDAASLAGAEGKILYMDLAFEATNWTLAQASVWEASLIWE